MIDTLPETSARKDWPRRVSFTFRQVARQLRALAAPSVITMTPSDEPANPAEGTIYFDRTAKALRIFDGTAWKNI